MATVLTFNLLLTLIGFIVAFNLMINKFNNDNNICGNNINVFTVSFIILFSDIVFSEKEMVIIIKNVMFSFNNNNVYLLLFLPNYFCHNGKLSLKDNTGAVVLINIFLTTHY